MANSSGRKSGSGENFLLGLAIIAVLIIGLVSLTSGPNANSFLTSIFGGVTTLSGGGQGTVYSNGTIICSGGVCSSNPNPTSPIQPANVIGFKTSIIADYTDGTNESIYQASNLPGLAVISVHGKPLRDLTALTAISLSFLTPAPANTNVDFQINYTYLIEDVGSGYWYQEVLAPVVDNGLIALVAFPPVSILASSVFPNQTALQGLTNLQRRVTYDAQVTAIVQPPPNLQLSLLPIRGESISFAEVNGDFSLGGGCTNCGGTGTTTPGVHITESIAQGTGVHGPSPPTTPCPSGDCGTTVVTQITPPCSGPTCNLSVPAVAATSGTKSSGGGTETDSGGTHSTTVVHESTGNSNVGNAPGGSSHEHLMSLIQPGCDLSTGSSSCGLPSVNYEYVPFMGEMYMVNPVAMGMFLLLALGVLIALSPTETRKLS